MNDKKLHKLVLTALLAALCALLTMVIRVPSPMGGYLNLGDCGVLLSAWLLGPVYGAAAAGIGSALADLLGYPLYAPATLVIKALMAVAAALLFRRLSREGRPSLVPQVVSGVAAEVIMIAGYFLFEAGPIGLGLAAGVNIPANGVQGVFGVVCAALVMTLLQRSRSLTALTRS